MIYFNPWSILQTLYVLGGIAALLVLERFIFLAQEGQLRGMGRITWLSLSQIPQDCFVNQIRVAANRGEARSILEAKRRSIFRFNRILQHFGELTMGLGLLGSLAGLTDAGSALGTPDMAGVLLGAFATTQIGLVLSLLVNTLFYNQVLEPKTQTLWMEYRKLAETTLKPTPRHQPKLTSVPAVKQGVMA